MRRVFLAAFAVMTAAAQTQVDLRTQAKSVDFSAATATRPVKTGTALPGTCTVGEMFFKTDASAGNNVYGCTAENTWSLQGTNLTIASQGAVIGWRPTVNFLTGPGLISLMADTGSQIDILWALDTAVNQTQSGEQSGRALLCASASGSNRNYQCSLTPTLGTYTAGMALHWKPDVNGAGGPTTLNVDTLGAVPLRLRDGASDPAATDIVAGELYDIWHDGTRFRLMTPASTSGGGAISRALIFDGSVSTLADGSNLSWTCGSGSGAQCTTNWTVPAGVHWVRVELWGAGAGGSGSTAGYGGGVGGAGGGHADLACQVTPGSGVAVAVGLGGAGGAADLGVADSFLGGSSSFGTCITVTGGQAGTYGTAGGYGGMISGAMLDGGWAHIASSPYDMPSDAHACTGANSAGVSGVRADAGGCGAGYNSNQGTAGSAGGKAIFGGGGGGSGSYNSNTTGAGGTSAIGGAGGHGGGWTSGTGVTACAAGSIPGGGGGGAAAKTSGQGNLAGCPGARGEVRVFYAK